MKVSDNKEVANHVGPESCVAHREMRREALTGERIGQPLLSLENTFDLGADAVDKAEGNTFGRVIASVRTTRRGRRHWHVRTLFAREPGDLGFDQPLRGLARIGKARSRSQ